MNTDSESLKTTEDEQQDDAVVHIQYDIASYPSDLTLRGIKQMWDSGSIVIPDFQRNFVWKIPQASLLIDSFLCGLPVPPVFFYISKENTHLVIDGQQRIMSIVFFLSGFFGPEDSKKRRQVFRLALGEGHPYNNMMFEDLDEADKRKLLDSTVLRAINIRQISPDDQGTSAYHIFERLNTGGTPLKPQEIRNCVYRGSFASALRNLNDDPNWRLLIGKPYPDKHQKDVELILRIFALAFYFERYEKPMKEFLNMAMAKNQNNTTKQANSFIQLFPLVAEMLVQKLPEKPFNLRGPLNTSVLDSIFCTMLLRYFDVPEDIAARYTELIQSDEFERLTTIGTTDVSTIEARFELVKNILFGG